MSYIELQITTNFTFLRGASHPEEMVEQAAALGYKQVAITDRNSFAGIVRGHTAAKNKGMRIIPACRLDLLDGPSLLAYPTNQQAYANLSELLTVGNLRQEKGKCDLYKADVYAYSKGLKFIIVPPSSLNQIFDFDDGFKNAVQEYREAFGNNVFIAGTRHYNGDDAKQLFCISQLPVPMVATNDVYYHIPSRRELQDILTCVREKCTIYNAGYKLQPNAERYLKNKAEMQRLFRHYPDALKYSLEIAEACTFSLDELRYVYPEGLTTQGRSPIEEVTYWTWMGAEEKFGDNIPEKIVQNIRYELDFIQRMDYAYYFLVVYDMVRFARSRHILCQGRGSAANSTVCYCLGITSVNPVKFDLLFERFVSDARAEPPDIDVDFEHERREEVIQYVYNKYGRGHAAIVATVTQQRQKGAIRDVGKAMGLSVDAINKLSGSIWEFTDEWFEGKLVAEQGFNPNDKHLIKTLGLTRQMMGFPRQLGQHTGGLVITRGKLSGLCPIMNARMENRTCVEWNKDDIDALGFFKIDILALGMLTCIRKAFDFAKKHYGLDLTLANVPQDDPKVYEMVSHAETIGVFQIESRAQQAMLPRLRPNCFYDLVIEVAIVRPGPIQGDMVHPYLRRRNGLEPVEYPSKELEEVLGKTLGVPLFQEQAMKVAIVAAGFTPAEADALRKSMATFKAQGLVKQFEEKLIGGMLKKGYTKEYAERIFHQLEGFGSYGFPESHAVSFALLVYVSSWLKCYYPDIFAAALLNSQPMGFYQPAQIIIDARKNGVEVRHVDVNYSEWDNILEEKVDKYCAIRLGFRQIKGMREEDIQLLVAGRGRHYANINQLRLAGISQAALEKLADADAFRSIGLDRREALWEVTSNDNPAGLFAKQLPEKEDVQLPAMLASEHVVQDYASIALSLKAHPVSFVREKLQQLHIISTGLLKEKQNGDYIRVAGIVLVRQRPGTAGGICFITIEDETGVANCVVFPNLFEEYRKAILQSRLLLVEGRLQVEGEVVHVIAERLFNITSLLAALTATNKEELPVLTLSRADEKSIPATENKKAPARKQAVQAEIFAAARNFK
jgi:error-prone DNA polymerase